MKKSFDLQRERIRMEAEFYEYWESLPDHIKENLIGK